MYATCNLDFLYNNVSICFNVVSSVPRLHKILIEISFDDLDSSSNLVTPKAFMCGSNAVAIDFFKSEVFTPHGTSVISKYDSFFFSTCSSTLPRSTNRPVPSTISFIWSAFSTITPPVGKSGPSTIFPSFSGVIFGVLIILIHPSNNSNELCGKMLLAIPNAIP